MIVLLCFFFFFQAEDGIRDLYVTGVQTCALPLSASIGVRARPLTAARSLGCWFMPVTMPRTILAASAVSVLTVASEVMAAGKVGLAWSVAASAAWYARRLAGLGRKR